MIDQSQKLQTAKRAASLNPDAASRLLQQVGMAPRDAVDLLNQNGLRREALNLQQKISGSPGSRQGLPNTGIDDNRVSVPTESEVGEGDYDDDEPEFGQPAEGQNENDEKGKDQGESADEQNPALTSEAKNDPTLAPREAASKTPENLNSKFKPGANENSGQEAQKGTGESAEGPRADITPRNLEDQVQQSLTGQGKKQGVKITPPGKKKNNWWKVLRASKWFLPILITLIGIVIAIALFVAIINLSKTSGTSPAQAAGPVSDKDWITKVLLLSGDKDVQNTLTESVLGEMRQGAADYINTANVSDAGKTAAQNLLTALDSYSAASDKETAGKAVVEAAKALIAHLGSCPGITTNASIAGIFGTYGGVKRNEIEDLSKGILYRLNAPANESETVMADPRMCKLLLYMAEHKSDIGVAKIKVGMITYGHTRLVKGTTSPSCHWQGQAMDISIRNDANVHEREIGVKYHDWFVKNEEALKGLGIRPHEVIDPVNDPRDHGDHVHVGFCGSVDPF